MGAIFRKEMRTYFTTISGYGFLGFFALITGYFFIGQNIVGSSANYNDTLTGSMIMFLILVPVLTMRLFAEESRQKTDQLLYSVPIKVTSIVTGKFLAAVCLYFIALVITMVFPVALSAFGNVDWGMTLTGYLGYFLMGMCLISVGLFISVLTDNQIVAAVSTFAVVFVLFMMDNITSSLPATIFSSLIFVGIVVIILAVMVYSSTKSFAPTAIFALFGFAVMTGVYVVKPTLYDGVMAKVLSWFSILGRFENFYLGIISIADVVYYITFSIALLYLTVNVIEKRRWN